MFIKMCSLNIMSLKRMFCGKLIPQIKINYSILSKYSSIFNEERRIYSTVGNDTFTPVYHLKQIVYISTLNSLKKYQYIATALAIPGSGMMEFMSFFPEYTTVGVTGMGLSLGLSITLGSYLVKDAVGLIYVTNDLKSMKISSVDFWGRRINTTIPVDDCIPISDLPSVPTDRFFTTLRRFSNNDTFKFFNRFGEVLDSDKLSACLGYGSK